MTKSRAHFYISTNLCSNIPSSLSTGFFRNFVLSPWCIFSQQPVQRGVSEVFYSIPLPPLESFYNGGDRLVQLGAWLVVYVHPEPEKGRLIINEFVTFKEFFRNTFSTFKPYLSTYLSSFLSLSTSAGLNKDIPSSSRRFNARWRNSNISSLMKNSSSHQIIVFQGMLHLLGGLPSTPGILLFNLDSFSNWRFKLFPTLFICNLKLKTEKDWG